MAGDTDHEALDLLNYLDTLARKQWTDSAESRTLDLQGGWHPPKQWRASVQSVENL